MGAAVVLGGGHLALAQGASPPAPPPPASYILLMTGQVTVGWSKGPHNLVTVGISSALP